MMDELSTVPILQIDEDEDEDQDESSKKDWWQEIALLY